MRYALPAVVLLFLWMLFARRRLAALKEDADRALARFHAQQFYRISALAALMDLTYEYTPGVVRVRSDVVQACCGMISGDSSLKDISKRERIMSQILTEIAQAAQPCPEMRSDARYVKYLNEMGFYEDLSCANRLLYNDSVNKLNRQLRLLPVSGRLLGFQKREYIEGPEDETPLHKLFPGALPYSGDRAPPDGK